MNILTIADQPPRQSILKTLRENNIDLIATLGDLELSQIRELEQVTNIPKIGVYGNHCSGNYFSELGIQNMHLQTFSFGGLIFGGFEGCVRYKESSYAKMYTQEESTKMLSDFPRVDIMLTHCPPYGINDDTTDIAHTGYQGLLDYITVKEPQYLFHGHTYPDVPVKKWQNTNIVYVYGDKIVTI